MSILPHLEIMYFCDCSWVLSRKIHEQSWIGFAGVMPMNAWQYLIEVTQCYMLCGLPCPSSLTKLRKFKKSLNSTSDETMRNLEGKQTDISANFLLSRKKSYFNMEELKYLWNCMKTHTCPTNKDLHHSKARNTEKQCSLPSQCLLGSITNMHRYPVLQQTLGEGLFLSHHQAFSCATPTQAGPCSLPQPE